MKKIAKKKKKIENYIRFIDNEILNGATFTKNH